MAMEVIEKKYAWEVRKIGTSGISEDAYKIKRR
jgi:hypothetical protein